MRIAIYTRVSPRQAEQVDKARGSKSRAAFLRDIVAKWCAAESHRIRQEHYRQRRNGKTAIQKPATAG